MTKLAANKAANKFDMGQMMCMRMRMYNFVLFSERESQKFKRLSA